MITAQDTKVIYIVDESAPPEMDEPLPAPIIDYLFQERRALITKLRHIEKMLRLPQSIPARKRPH